MSPTQLKNIRVQAGLTQAQLAKFLGLGSASRISEYENGKRRPSKSVLRLYEILSQQKK